MIDHHPVMILAGGTGGHVYPALAVAERLMAQDVPVVWMGTRAGLEGQVVPRTGIPMRWLSVQGLRKKHLLTWLSAPWRLNLAVYQALRHVMRCKPRVVLGMGGFVAGPGGTAAYLLGKPLVIHEQNAIAGLTNRLLAPLSQRVLAGYPKAFSRDRTIHTGNPVRASICALADPHTRFAARAGRLRLLVLGGSLGAQALNNTVPLAVKMIPEGQRPEVWHQAGRRNLEQAERAYRLAEIKAKVEAYIEDSAAAYAWADLVIARAGALTVAELAAAGVGAILVPYPHAADNHQQANAECLARLEAAVVLPQAQLSAARLAGLIEPLLGQRETLLQMAKAARRQAKPDAAETVAQICLEVAQYPRRGKVPVRDISP